MEYQNYQLPMLVNENYYFMSGMRASEQEDFRFLKIPADENDSLQGFMIFNHYTKHEENLPEVVRYFPPVPLKSE